MLSHAHEQISFFIFAGMRKVKVPTADAETLSCGVDRVQLIVNGVDPVMVKELVVEGKLLDFDLLSRMDAIKSLDGVRINRIGEVCSTTSDVPAFVALNID